MILAEWNKVHERGRGTEVWMGQVDKCKPSAGSGHRAVTHKEETKDLYEVATTHEDALAPMRYGRLF